jgi:Bacterial dnaA protein helix-turn-helix
MGANPQQFSDTPMQLVLRGRRADPLVQTDDDWRELGVIAARMLFWCGGAIYGCRCEGNEIRFALQVAHAPLGAMAHHISGAYALHLQRAHGLRSSIFKHYTAIPLLDQFLLDALVLWMHRPGIGARIWTTEEAYLTPNSMPWISTERVLAALTGSIPGVVMYRRRKSEKISPQVVARFSRRPQRARRANQGVNPGAVVATIEHATPSTRPSIESIARVVADICDVSYEDMLTGTRKRSVSKARVIATVLSTRNGATAAAAARLFNRSRSTLIEQVEHYRTTQTEIFTEAESILEASLGEKRE